MNAIHPLVHKEPSEGYIAVPKNIAQIAEAILSRTAGADTITLAQKVQSDLKHKDDLVEYVANFNPEAADDLNSPSTLLEVAELIAEHLKE
jgi:hypothetical protein